MEYINTNSKKIRIKFILIDNNNWWNFFTKHKSRLREGIITNIVKILSCGTKFLGFKEYKCFNCSYIKKVCFSCKSKFCTSCGKKATDIWIKKHYDLLPKTIWQHITFTLPSQIWPLFWYNRKLFNIVPKFAANIIKQLAAQKGAIPGIFLAIHSFGRDLKRNAHFHLSTTAGGISFDHKRWIKLYFLAESIKKMWKYQIITLLRELFKNGELILPNNLHNKPYTHFNRWLNQLYQKKWVVHLNKQSENHKLNIDYIAKYLKRPPIAETRILSYDGNNVTFKYFDHHSKTYQKKTFSVLDFIGRLVAHIHDKYFKSVRYFGWLSNKTRNTLLPIVYKLLKNIPKLQTFLPSWQKMIQNEFGVNPLICPICKKHLFLENHTFPKKISYLIQQHQFIVTTNC